ncbi:recombination protein NinG [Burkholderia gladioli]|uniref:Recombination protein NinG n=1 Tax=Burkholderia gladioli TaxID=28095 RepID=A0AB38U5Z3_BURGA|nr:recombination protein NinG [Burkholderia gladioli]UWX75355.1 recombination protein NinG [Burkholderia gladioli]
MRATLKPKKCRACGVVFQPARSMQKVCSPACAIALNDKAKAKKAAQAQRAERKDLRERLEKAKTRGTHLRELQGAFNAWIRMRDAGQPCIACGRYHQGQNHAGHYRSVGSCPELRFEPDNVHLSCQPCNVHLSGNLINYRINLIKKIGLERVEWLEGPHVPKKLTIAEIQDMKQFYRAEVRRMKREAA